MILELIQQSLGSREMDQLSHQLGTGRQQTEQAVSAALPLLLGALGRNSADPQGAAALSTAVERDHDGSILDNLSTFLGHGGTDTGDGILKHVFGNRRSGVEESLQRASGLRGESISKLLALLAPVVMGALGKAQRSQGIGAGDLSGTLQQEAQSSAAASPFGSLLALLDSDRDGDVTDDVGRIGSQLLGRLFDKK
ncbi:MAG TPA: DUF937 domain-containing protein [Acidobacteriota bacterium]|nr:DUF937 domain-containing protein [Acidobacteriota bacterium]